MERDSKGRGRGWSRWGRRVGSAAFVFFLIKGLAWLALAGAGAAAAMR